MSVEQVIYTSSGPGIDESFPGFKIYSYSKNVNASRLEAIRNNIHNYQYPNTLSGIVESNQDLADYPEIFKFFPVDENTLAVAQTVYIGKEYAGGRMGNFFSHALQFNREELDLYPINLYKNHLLRTGLTKEEIVATEAPNYLDSLGLSEFAAYSRGAANFTEVKQFINSVERKKILVRMLSVILAIPLTGKRLLICDNEEAIPLWIQSITSLFPVLTAKSIYFTTYEYDPSASSVNQYSIVGVLPDGTNYHLSDNEINRKYSVFDLTQDKIPEVDTSLGFFELVVNALDNSYEKLFLFQQLLTGINYVVPAPDIDAVYKIFQLIVDANSLTPDEQVAAIALANNLNDSAGMKYICDFVVNNVSKFIKAQSPELSFEVYKLINSTAVNTRDEGIVRAVKTFGKSVDKLLIAHSINLVQGGNHRQLFSELANFIDKDMVNGILVDLEKKVQFQKPDNSLVPLISDMRNLIYQQNLPVPLQKLNALQFGISLQRIDAHKGSEQLKAVLKNPLAYGSVSFDGLSSDIVVAYLDWVLPMLLVCVEQPDDFAVIDKTLNEVPGDVYLQKCMIIALRHLKTTDRSELFLAFFEYFVGLKSLSNSDIKLFLQQIARVLYELSDKQFNKIDKKLSKNRAVRISGYWDYITQRH
jgi:hypothetical protein